MVHGLVTQYYYSILSSILSKIKIKTIKHHIQRYYTSSRLECSVCSHSWFQSIDRIMTMQDGFEMIQRPAYEIERVHLNLRENKAPNFMGEQKLYVGNIAFECGEKDIYEVFNEVGSVGDVSLVRDDTGKVRGFGFVTMRTVAEGEKAIAELDGAEVKGRNIAVRPSNN